MQPLFVLHGPLQGRQYYLNVCRGPAGENWSLITTRKSLIALPLTQLGVPQGQGYRNLLDEESSPTEQTDESRSFSPDSFTNIRIYSIYRIQCVSKTPSRHIQ